MAGLQYDEPPAPAHRRGPFPPRQNLVGIFLRVTADRRLLDEPARNSICYQYEHIAAGNRQYCLAQGWQFVSDDAAPKQKLLSRRRRWGDPEESSFDISHSQPGHGAVVDRDGRQAEHGSTRSPRFLMTSQHELRDRVIGMAAQCRRDRPGCLRGFRPVAQTVNDSCKVTIRGRHQDVCIASFGFSRVGKAGHAPLHAGQQINRGVGHGLTATTFSW